MPSNYYSHFRSWAMLTGLHKRVGLLFVASSASCDAAEMSTSRDNGSCKINISNGLLLYYNQYSFYSQKVVLALQEKKLPFESHIIDLSSSQQYDSWFLELNPRGEVPVLQDQGRIIPDSGKIIDYLEDNFSNGDIPRLIPLEPEARKKVNRFRALIDPLPSGVITMGSFFHPELVAKPKAPFFAPIRKLLANAEINSSKTLRETAEKNPKIKEILLQKAEFQDKKHLSVVNKEEYIKILNQIDEVLSVVEDELSTHIEGKENHWLCTENYTLADISLTILLERLNQLGFEYRFWKDGKRPHLEKYYARVKLRDTFKKTVPNTFFLIKTFLYQKATVIGISIVGTCILVFCGFYFFA